MPEAAGAVTGDNAREVVRAVADERRALLAQRGQHQLAHFAVGHGQARRRVDDLHVHVVVPHVHAVVRVARDADAGAVHLGQAVDVVDLHAQLAGNARAHFVAPALGADDALAQAELVADAALGDFLSQQERVGTGGAEHGGLQILHHAQLFLGVAGAHGNGHGTQVLGAQLKADARRPQAVTGGDLDAIGIRDARGLVTAGELDSPVRHVLLRVRHDDRRARGAGRRVDAHDFLIGHGLQAQRVHAAQVVLLGERQLLEIFLGSHVGEVDALVLHGVERRARFQSLELLLDERELVGGHLHRSSSFRWMAGGVAGVASSPPTAALEARAIDQPKPRLGGRRCRSRLPCLVF